MNVIGISQRPCSEEDGTIIVYRGMGCAESNKSELQQPVVVEEAANLPRYAGNATVLLKGWRLRGGKVNFVTGKRLLSGSCRVVLWM